MLHSMSVNVLYMQATELLELFTSLSHTFTSYCHPYHAHVAVVCEQGLYLISHDMFE